MTDKDTIFLPELSFSWIKRATIFIGIFGFLWLILEPFSLFGIASSFIQKLNIWGYLGLIGTALVGVVVTELNYKRHSRIGKDSITIVILITRTGNQVKVNVPRDMAIQRFLELFVKRVSKFTDEEWVSGFTQFYRPRLVLKRNKNRLPLSLTFREAEVSDGDIFEIQGEEIRKVVFR